MSGKVTESQVLYDSSKYAQISDEEKLFPLNGKHKKSLSVILDRAKEKVFSAKSDKLRDEAFEELQKVFDERISIVALRMKDCSETTIMIFLSFHNVLKVRENIGADVRARAIEGFCQLVTKLHNLTGCVVLAGADLNQQLIEPIPYPILDYMPTPRRLRSGQIDYFILESDDHLRESVQPFDFIGSVMHGYLKLHALNLN